MVHEKTTGTLIESQLLFNLQTCANNCCRLNRVTLQHLIQTRLK